MSKGLNALHRLLNRLEIVFIETNSTKYLQDIEKELIALEIIKNKIAFDEGWEIFLTEEEKEILKEVGLWN